MNHDRIELLLDDYLDDALPAAQALEVETHLETCAECEKQMAGLRSLRAATARLPQSIEPGRDLWPAIDARIRRGDLLGRSLWSARYPLAAAAVLLIAISSALTALFLRPDRAREGAGAPSGDRPAAAAFVVQWQAVEEEYLRASGELLATLEASKERLAPGAVELIENNLRIIDTAIQESRAALALSPHNRELLDSLLGAYKKKVEVLRYVNRLSAEL